MQTWQEYLGHGYSVIPIYGIEADGQCQCRNPNCENVGKHPKYPWKKSQETRAVRKTLQVWFRNPTTNIGIVTGQISNLVVVDEDTPGAADLLELPKTFTVTTGSGGKHYYFKYPDTYVKTGKLVPGLDIKGDGGFVVAPPSLHRSGNRYEPDDLTVEIVPLPSSVLDLIKYSTSNTPTSDNLTKPLVKGERDTGLTRLAGSLLGRSVRPSNVLVLLRAHNMQNCDPPLPDSDIEKIVYGISASEQVQKSQDQIDEVSQFREGTPPPRLDPIAYQGLLGEIWEAVEPYTEACLEAILFSFLTAFGNKLGRTAHLVAQESIHAGNLFTILVGESAKARKGTAVLLALKLLAPPQPKPKPDPPDKGKVRVNFSHVQPWRPQWGGIASGEGIIDLLRDDLVEYDHRSKTHKVVEGSGVIDKRLLIIEDEFGSVCRKADRQGSTIWPTLRSLWDTGTAATAPRSGKIATTNAHLSLLGSITHHELKTLLPKLEMSTGTTNRILWVWTRRGKILPRGEPVPDDLMESLRRKITDVLKFGQALNNLSRTDEAEKYWDIVYRKAEEKASFGGLDSATSRAPAQMARLQVLYAVLSGSSIISIEHIRAAQAVWEYSEKTLRYLFGTETDSPLENKILNILESQVNHQASRTVISERLSNNYQARELDKAYQRLRNDGMIKELKLRPKRGRPITVIQLLSPP